MSDLTPKQIANLKQLLLERQAELETLISNAEAGSRPVSLDQPIGRVSRVDALQQQSMSQASQRAAEKGLQQIAAALQRIASGDYGLCVICEEEIGLARLQARPEAPFCIDCQGEREQKS